jgi:hypothetical protein
MGEVVDWWSAFSGDFSGKCTADPKRWSLTYYISIDAVSVKDVPLGVSSINLIIWGSYTPKALILGTSMISADIREFYQDFSLNVYARISAKPKRNITLVGSKCASRQDTQCTMVKTKEWGHFRGQIYKSLFQRQIYTQISKHSRKCPITS